MPQNPSCLSFKSKENSIHIEWKSGNGLFTSFILKPSNRKEMCSFRALGAISILIDSLLVRVSWLTLPCFPLFWLVRRSLECRLNTKVCISSSGGFFSVLHTNDTQCQSWNLDQKQINQDCYRYRYGYRSSYRIAEYQARLFTCVAVLWRTRYNI